MKTILLVDDCVVDRRLAAGLLEDGNTRFLEADDGADAAELLQRRRPDLVLTDLVMPRMDGLELVKYIRPRWPQVPVILMTAHGSESIAAEALAAGAVSYVPKSRQAELLKKTVGQVWRRSMGNRWRSGLLDEVRELRCVFDLGPESLEQSEEKIDPLLDLLQQTLAGMGYCDATARVRVGVALEEALRNAITHGVGPRRRRFGPQKNVSLEVELSPRIARFVIRDPGAGFDPLAPSAAAGSERFERGGGRGLTLIRGLMDDVCFNGVGNQVTLFKRPEVIAA